MRRLFILLLATLPAFASTVTSAEINGFDTTVVTGTAAVSYFGDTGLDPSSISASTMANAITLGPVRPGFIEILGLGTSESGGGTVTIGGYSFSCSDFGCAPQGEIHQADLPFTLGVPFQINISAFANSLNDGSSIVNFQFSLFESVDLGFSFAPFASESVLVYDAPAVPEPATVFLCAGGLALLAVGRRIRRSV